MAVVSIDELKEQIGWSADLGAADDALMERKIDAAQAHIENLLGFKIEEKFTGGAPADLVEAVCQLAAHWIENREATLVGVTAQELPFGVWSIVAENREYSFDG